MRLLILLGCAGAPAPPEESGAAPTGTDPTDFTWTQAEPSLDAVQVGAALQTAIDAGLPDPGSLLDWFQWALEQGDPNGCPYVPEPYALGESFAGCVSSSGWRYAGLTHYETVADGFEMTGDASLTDPAGLPFPCAGYVRSYRTGDDWLLRFGGQWGYPSADGWVAAVPDLTLDLSGGAGGDVTLVGGFGPSGAAMYFDEVRVDDEGHHGVLRQRDVSGGWYTLVLDPDGCGPVDWYGAELGEACVDLRPAVADLLGRLEAR